MILTKVPDNEDDTADAVGLFDGFIVHSFVFVFFVRAVSSVCRACVCGSHVMCDMCTLYTVHFTNTSKTVAQFN